MHNSDITRHSVTKPHKIKIKGRDKVNDVKAIQGEETDPLRIDNCQ